MASEAAVKQLEEAMAVAISAPVEELIENPQKWGEINFKAVETELRIGTNFLHLIHDSEIDKLPENIISGMAAPATQLSNAIKRITTFTLTQGDANQIRQQISHEIRAASNSLLTNFSIAIPILGFIEKGASHHNNELKQILDEAKEATTKFLNEIEDTAKDAKSALSATREAAAKTGVGVFTQNFAGEATYYDKVSKAWLLVTGSLGFSTIVLAIFYSKIFTMPEAGGWHLFQYATSKVVVIGLLITATIWCGRVYMTARHHETINKHRANALATFQAFVEATTEPSVQDAVLLETTRSIFTITPSGYVGGNSGGTESNTIIEVMKNATAKGEK